ncbi:MAG: endonuclease [Flavobacteriales bacterium]|nr:endonuclease [Flavobacteriales bacterium]
MKKLLSFPIALLLWLNAAAQAPLPTSFNFDDPLPTGWSELLDVVVGNTRYTNGLVNAACRLDATGEYVLVNFGDVCGSVTYNVKGQGTASGDSFSIQESTNGNTWTAMRVLSTADLNAASDNFVEYTDVPQASSRYIRFFFTNKQSGRNIALDEISLAPQVATNAQEINVSVAGNAVFTGNTYVIGNLPSTTFTITNFNLSGGSALNVTSMSITGTNAADFSISGVSTPFDVAANGTESFDVNFSAGANGSRYATLTIENNDANGDESTYVINLLGIGGNLATEPTASAINLSISDLTTYGYDVSFSAGSPVAEKYLVTRGINAAFLTPPTDGQTYVKGDYIDAITQVVHVGPAGSFRPTNVVANTEYNFYVYAFNGPSGYENYRTDSPLIGTTQTPDNMMGNYYQGIDATTANFLGTLQSRLNSPYSQTYYSNYAPVMIDNFAARDTTDGQRVVNCVYSGYAHLYPGAFFYDVISREHTWPHSWMPTWPDEEGMEYSDLHNLFPAHQNSANAVRSNRPLGVVVNQTSSFLGAKYGTDANGNLVYEPRDSHKGDAARAIMYMAAKWNGTGDSWELPNPIDFLVQYGQDQDVLKQWHWQDPPSNYEIARNDYVESVQGNRNPFVDSVNWVCYIDFSDMTLVEPTEIPCLTTPNSIEEVAFGTVGIYPNPTEGLLNMTLDMRQSDVLNVHLFDISGRSVYSHAINAPAGASQHQLDLNGTAKGVYLLQVNGANGTLSQKVILQ